MLFSQQPKPEPIEREINDRRCIEREKLTHDKSAHDGNAKRAAQFGTGARSERQRQSAKERGHGGHENRTKSQHAGFEYGVFGAFAGFALGLQSKIYHHDGILLDDADQQDNADDRNDIEILFEQHESENGADAGGRQRGNDGERVNEAFVQDPENNVDREKSGDDKVFFVVERILVSLQGAGEKTTERRRRAAALFHLVNGQGSVAYGETWRDIKGDVDRGKQASVV